MERKTALAKLRTRLGKGFAWRENKGWKPKEVREAALEANKVLKDEKLRLSTALDTLRKTLLQDPEYQNILAAYTAVRKQMNANTGVMLTKRFTVGTANSLFFHVAADGDSWEEVLAELDRKEGKK